MKTLLFLLAFAGAAVAGPISEEYCSRIADAIYFAEGGTKARIPYGILSVKTTDPRRTCMNTIRNTWGRWESAGRPGEFISFLGNRYCPVQGDRTGLNRHWVKNVKNRLNAGSRYAVESK